ncbi:MAG: chorismate synthase, partial [Methanobacterium sp.]
MSGNTTGKLFKVTTFGSSHGKALGAVVDGCPAGLDISIEDLQRELDKRKPGTSKITTSRGETDQVQVLSGIFEGKTDGTPIAAVVYNKD